MDEHPRPTERARIRMPGYARRFESVAALVALVLLVMGVVLVLRPFVTALLWAGVLAFSTWPLYARMRAWLGLSRSIAALVMTLILGAAFVLPLAFLSTTIAENATRAIDLVRNVLETGPPGPPSWVVGLPLFGDQLAQAWDELAHDSGRFTELIRPYLIMARGWAITGGLAVGAEVLELTLSVIVSFFFYRDGERVLEEVQLMGRRLIGDRAQHLLLVASSTVRGVVYGIIGTSLGQAALATIGFAIIGLPNALFLGFLTFFLAFIPSGPPLVWAPLAFWLFSDGQTGAGVFLVLWGLIVVGAVDHFLKPVLISRESKAPLLLVFFGVVGGALAFGVIGVFLGPVLLAVAFALVRDWVALIRAQPVEGQSAV